jgi:hypothetical protein
MKIWAYSRQAASRCLIDDRAMMQQVTGGVRLEGNGTDGRYLVELTEDECRRIAELLGYHRYG